MHTTTPLATLALLSLFACADTATDPSEDDGTGIRIEGRVSDSDGQRARLAGEGSLAAASTVEAHEIEGDGTLTLTAEADVKSDGSYALTDVDAETWYVVQTRDDRGDLIGSVIVEPSSRSTIQATPITIESSTEAEVFLDVDADADLWPHIRSRVDADMAVAVRTSSNVDQRLDVLATSVASSGYAQIRTWEQAGYDVDSILDAQREATLNLSIDLANEDDAASVTFLQRLESAQIDAGMSDPDRARAQTNAGITFRSALNAYAASDLADAASDSSARAEANAWSDATLVLLEEAGASQAELDAAADANADLRVALRSSDNMDDAAEAAAEWRAQFTGSADQSILGSTLGADLILGAAIDAAVDLAVDATAAVENSIAASAQSSVDGAGLNAEAFAVTSVDALTDHRTTTAAQLQSGLALLPNSDVTAELIVDVETAFSSY